MGIRDFAVVPFFAGIGGVVLMSGTLFGQGGHDTFDSADNIMSDMGGMNMKGGNGGNALTGSMGGMNMGSSGGSSSSSTSSSMPGMNMGSSSGSSSSSTASSTSSSMPGMNMGSASGAASAGGTMTMPDGSTMAATAMSGSAAPMDMSDPKMVASMPGGLHSTCAADVCTVIFAPKSTGVAKVLGTTAKLDSAKAGQVVLTVGKKQLTLRAGKPVTEGKLRIELTSSTAAGYTVKFTKSK